MAEKGVEEKDKGEKTEEEQEEKKSGGAFDQNNWQFTDPYEIALIRSLATFPGKVQECADGLKIHPMAAYLRDCAQLFNQFYRECPVIKATGQERESRLVLVQSFKTVVAQGLDLLGIEAPEYTLKVLQHSPFSSQRV